MLGQARAKLLSNSIDVLLMVLVVMVALAIALIFIVAYGVSPGAGISTIGSSRSSNSVRSALLITACIAYIAVM